MTAQQAEVIGEALLMGYPVSIEKIEARLAAFDHDCQQAFIEGVRLWMKEHLQ